MPLPKFPSLKSLPNPIKSLTEIMQEGRQQIEKAKGGIRTLASELHNTAPEEATKQGNTPVASGTACLPCSRDHFITTSSALSEGIRFARDEGVRSPEVLRRIRIALGELDAMERIDLAPEEMAKLKGAERELADWALRQSRDLRHAITAVRDVETMEQAAAKASGASEEFMKMMWGLPECDICDSLKTLKEYIEKRKREREAKAVE